MLPLGRRCSAGRRIAGLSPPSLGSRCSFLRRLHMNRFSFRLLPFGPRLLLRRCLLSSRIAASVDRTGSLFESGSRTCGDTPRWRWRHFSSGNQLGALWGGSSYETLLNKFEFALQDDSLEEAWEAFSNFKRLHGFPELQLVRKLIALLCYSSNAQWLQKAHDLAVVISEEKPDLVRCESLSRLSLALARTQMPIPASTVIRIMLERGKFPSKDILCSSFLHLVKSQIGSYLAADILIEICQCFLSRSSERQKLENINLIKPTTTTFNLVLDSCVRFASLVKARQIIELMPQVGTIADADSVVIIANIYEMMGERDDLKNLKVHIDGISSAMLNRRYCSFYDSLLSLHFKYNDIAAAAELMLDFYRRAKSLQSSSAPPAKMNGLENQCYLQVGSSNLCAGSRIVVDPKNLENDFLIAERNHCGFVHFVDGELAPSNKALAKLINICVKERKVDELSGFLIIMHKETDSKQVDLCSDVLHACIVLDWLDAAHDILDDLELAGVPIGANAYVSLLNAYSKKNMLEESEVLLKQIRKVGIEIDLSDELGGGSVCAFEDTPAYPSDKKAPSSLEKSCLIQYLELENRGYNSGGHLIYEFNSSISFFCKTKMMEDAQRTLKRMREKNVQPTVLTFGYLVSGYSSLEMYRNVAILWGEIRRQTECGALAADRDLFDCLLWNFLRAGYFGRAMEIIDYMLKHHMYVDKWKHRREFLKHHRYLYGSLRASDCRTDAQKKRLEHVQAFKKWADIK